MAPSQTAPVTAPAPATIPPTIEERSVAFTSEGTVFPAILTLPKASSRKLPIVVLVAGSGPHDADETVGPNKPLRDIAWALALRNIATLRYPKRTQIARETFTGDHVNLDWEVTRDAVAALTFAATQPTVDAHRIFLLGHSLGGTMAPAIAAARLAQQPNSIAGLILLAPGVLPVDVTLTRQILSQQKRQGATEAQLKEVQQALDTMFATIKDPATSADQTVGLGSLRMPERYWRDWLAQDPAAILRRLSLPSLVLRGDQDIQISHEDFVAIVAAQSAPHSQHEELPGLNHLFLPVTGTSTGEEYGQPGHVPAIVTEHIAAFIHTLN